MKGFTIQNSIDLLEKTVQDGISGGSTTAEKVTYDNTTSHLTADDVQEAIDEIVSSMPTTAANLTYDNTSSGLTADDVQEAIDEVAGALLTPFIDTSNVIVSTQTAGVETLTYTPTVNCAISYVLLSNNTNSRVEIDDVELIGVFATSQQVATEGVILVKAGQKFSLVSGTSGCKYTVYGLIPAITPAPTQETRTRKKK